MPRRLHPHPTLKSPFIVVVYTGEPEGTLFDYHALTLIPALMWIFLLVALGGANTASVFGPVRTERTRD